MNKILRQSQSLVFILKFLNLDFTEDFSELTSGQGAAVSQFALLDGLEGTTSLGGNQEVERLASDISILD